MAVWVSCEGGNFTSQACEVEVDWVAEIDDAHDGHLGQDEFDEYGLGSLSAGEGDYASSWAGREEVSNRSS